MNLRIVLCSALIGLSATTSLPAKPVSQLDEAKAVTASYTMAETIKAVENQLVAKLIDERANRTLSKAAEKTAKRLLDKALQAGSHLSQNEKISLLKQLTQRSGKAIRQLSELSASRWSAYVGVLKNNKAALQLKKIIAQAGDEASQRVLKQLAHIDIALQQGKNISTQSLQSLMDGIKTLPPERAKAAYDLVAKKIGSDWQAITKGGSATASAVGTVVDGVFVLNDAYSIYYSNDSAEEKFIQASGKIIEYGSSTGAMVAVGSAQGAGATALSSFLPGLVVALSANRVATLYSEIMLLQRDRALAKSKQEQARLDLALLVRRQFLKINQLLKAGDTRQAEYYLIKTEKFIHKHEVTSLNKLFELLNGLKARLKAAKRIQAINAIINEARYPYRQALQLYRQGRELKLAQQQAQQAITILDQHRRRYQELNSSQALKNCKQLLAAIQAAIAAAQPLNITQITGEKRVFSGSDAYFTAMLSGGIPDYQPASLEGAGDSNSVTFVWTAPDDPGEVLLPIRVQDHTGQQISTQIAVEVLPATEEVLAARNDPYRQYADPLYAIDFSELVPLELESQQGFYGKPYPQYWGDNKPCGDTTCWEPFHVVQYVNRTSKKPQGMALGFSDQTRQRLRIIAYYLDDRMKAFRDQALRDPSRKAIREWMGMWQGSQGIKGYATFDEQGRPVFRVDTSLRGNAVYRHSKSYENGKLIWETRRRNGTIIEEKSYRPEPTTEVERIKERMFQNMLPRPGKKED